MNVEYHYLDWDQSPERRAERGGHTLKFGWEPALFTFQSINQSILETPVLDCGEVDQGDCGEAHVQGPGETEGAGSHGHSGGGQRGCRHTEEWGFVPSCPSTALWPETASLLFEKMRDFRGGAVVKNPPANVGDTGLSPGPGRSPMPQSN